MGSDFLYQNAEQYMINIDKVREETLHSTRPSLPSHVLTCHPLTSCPALPTTALLPFPAVCVARSSRL
jgi:hypothetical protein